MDTIFMFTLFVVFLFAIYKMWTQIKKIRIPQIKGPLYILLQPLIIVVFLLVAWFGSAPFFGYILSITAAIMFMLSLHNKGMTVASVIPLMPGYIFRGMLSREFKFQETSNWLIIEKKNKLKVRFTVDKYQSVYYIDFPLEKKETIIEYIEKQNMIVFVEEYK